MRIFQHAVGAALVVLSTTATVRAREPGIKYDCDTAANNFSELVLPAPAGPFVVTGKVRLQKIVQSKDYIPLTRIWITEPEPDPAKNAERWAGFSISAISAKALGLEKKVAKPVLQFLGWDEGRDGKAVPHEPIGPLDDAESLAFSLSYDGAAVVTSIAGREFNASSAIRNPVVRIICSTGEFLYTDLRIEKAG